MGAAGGAWRMGGVGRLAGLIVLGLLLLLLGQSVWAAGYRPPRSLGAWHLQGSASSSRPAQANATAQPAAKSAAEWYAGPASKAKAPAAAAAPQPPEAVKLSPEERDYWDAAAGKQKGSSQGGAAGAAGDGMTEAEEAAAAAEAEARADENFKAVHGLTGEPEAAAVAAESGPADAATPPPAAAATAPAPAATLPPAAAAAAAPPAAAAKAAANNANTSASAVPAAVSVLHEMPYSLSELPNAAALFKAHAEWQARVLKEKRKGVPAVKVETGQGHGLGNRLPGIGTGFALAVLTGRLFFLQSTVHEFIEFPFPCVWQEFESLYAETDRCDLGHFAKFINPQLHFCGGPAENKTATLIQQPCQFDYMLPMFQINPTLKPHFDKFFPDGEVYSKIAQHLFKLKPVLQEALKPYEAPASNCLVGMHLRTKKPGTSAPVEQFAAIARALAVARPGSVFVAADTDLHTQMQEQLPGREVWWNKMAAAELWDGNRTAAGNPGTELSAMMDLWLLVKCKNIILTPSSSIGGLAAAIAGVMPVFANHGPHTDPFTNPWFWKSVTSEPCFVKGADVHKSDTALARLFRKQHPLYVYHSQCHYAASAIGVPAPTWECTAENCREWRR